jgi:hypothetical protein
VGKVSKALSKAGADVKGVAAANVIEEQSNVAGQSLNRTRKSKSNSPVPHPLFLLCHIVT